MVLKLQQRRLIIAALFENDVNMYGTQALCKMLFCIFMFENDVNMYGTQACSKALPVCLCLRMM